MSVGAIGAGVGTVGFQPYTYNANSVSASSMSKVSAIPDDALTGGVDASGLVSNQNENINPLRRGETANFADVMMMQLQMGQNNANRIMPASGTTASDVSQTGTAVSNAAQDLMSTLNPNDPNSPESSGAMVQASEDAGAEVMSDMLQSQTQPQASNSNYAVSRAIDAYSQSMGIM